MFEILPGEMVGASENTLRLTNLINTAAQGTEAVTFTGEAGTGKELAARLVHERSSRKKSPFLMIDCSLYYERELKRELFGYVSSGANPKSRKGLFEFARQGTCYLSRIEELTPGIQVSLLEFLRSRKFPRLGDGKLISSAVRIVVSSDKNIEGFVEAGLFDAGLFTELSTLTAHIAPLRERKEDIPPIIERITAAYSAERAGKPVSLFAPEALLALKAYAWPHNVDELQREVSRLLESGQENIRPEHLAVEISSYWLGQRGDPEVRKVLDELDGYMREFRILSQIKGDLGELLDVPFRSSDGNVLARERDLMGEL